ncbi:MAG: leucyl aminopeptidase [Rhodospirillales bacterium]|nr:leucyl aminopeptidase [Rhodospirillales bacterium]
MKIAFAGPGLPDNGTVVVFASLGRGLAPTAKKLDAKTKGVLSKALSSGQFSGKKAQVLSLIAPRGTKLEQILLVGLGKPDALDELSLAQVGAKIYVELAHAKTVTVIVDAIEKAKWSPAEMAAEIGNGLRLHSYRFDKYRTKLAKEDKPTFGQVRILCDGFAKARTLYAPKDKVADGVFFTRDLVSEPPNVLYPETLAQQAQTLKELGVKVEVLGVAEMKKLGLNALLGVGQGSARESKMAILQWNGAGKSTEGPLAFIGKGVTFDTGGISIKPSAGMQDMKWDMGGAGAVLGLMKALAGRKARVNAVGAVGLVENMPDGNAQRPGDIVKSLSGQTIEIQNTDAEGRLVLADVLWYTKERFKPRFMIDLATLTGAILIALGHEMAGMFSNDDALCEQLSKAGNIVGEKVWRMPVSDDYDKIINSDIADMKNIGDRGAGSITAAQFLKRFVGTTPWVHLDIAGMAWSDKARPPVPKGGTGFGVRLLERFIADHYEEKA